MYLISYDISSDKLRNKIFKELKNYGTRKQFSVFECNLDRKRYKELYSKLLDLMRDSEEGDIRIYSLCERCQSTLQIIGVDKDSTRDSDENVVIVL